MVKNAAKQWWFNDMTHHKNKIKCHYDNNLLCSGCAMVCTYKGQYLASKYDKPQKCAKNDWQNWQYKYSKYLLFATWPLYIHEVWQDPNLTSLYTIKHPNNYTQHTPHTMVTNYKIAKADVVTMSKMPGKKLSSALTISFVTVKLPSYCYFFFMLKSN